MPGARRLARLLVPLVAVACHRTAVANPERSASGERSPDVYRVAFETTQGRFVVEAHRAWAPLGNDRFYTLTRTGYFDDSRFFRVVPQFIAQFGIAGSPRMTSQWVDRAIADDSVRQSNVRGTIAFAMTGPNTRTTQLFISLVDNSRLDAQGFAPLGRVVEGMDVVDRIYSGYGESSGGGVRAGKQQRLLTEGNAYLDREFPRLDRITRAHVQ